MAIYTGKTSDTILNGHLATIRAAEYGSDARTAMASAVQRCYELAKIKAGATNVPQSSITTQTDRIKNAMFGEEVRDALRTGLQFCFTARGIDPSQSANNAFSRLMEAQTGESLKNGILESIVRCGKEVNQ